MPMTITLEKLNSRCALYGEDPQMEDETEEDFRARCAKACAKKDQVEAVEVLTGCGWDKWTRVDVEKAVRMFPDLRRNPAVATLCARHGV